MNAGAVLIGISILWTSAMFEVPKRGVIRHTGERPRHHKKTISLHITSFFSLQISALERNFHLASARQIEQHAAGSSLTPSGQGVKSEE